MTQTTKTPRHIARSKVQAFCGAAMQEPKHDRMPGIPLHQRVQCAKCLLAVNAIRARRLGWRVRLTQ